MHVRMARFEGLNVAQVERDYEQFQEMIHMQERPEGMSEEVFETLRTRVRRVVSMVDRDAGVSLDLTFTDSAEDAQAVHEALDSLTPPEGSGRRTETGIYELMVDETL